jgi:hypothetical protein
MARGKTDQAFEDFWEAFERNAPLADLSRDVLTSPAIRGRFFDCIRDLYGDDVMRKIRGEILDAAFPNDPFAR